MKPESPYKYYTQSYLNHVQMQNQAQAAAQQQINSMAQSFFPNHTQESSPSPLKNGNHPGIIRDLSVPQEDKDKEKDKEKEKEKEKERERGKIGKEKEEPSNHDGQFL